MPLQPYQQRVVEELSDLSAKIERIKSFADSTEFAALDAVDSGLLIAQWEAMSAYSTILDLRIIRFQAGAA